MHGGNPDRHSSFSIARYPTLTKTFTRVSLGGAQGLLLIVLATLNREPTPQARKVAGLSRPGVSKVEKKKKNPRGGGDSNS